MEGSKMSTLRIGVIGCGYWGPNLIRNFVEIPTAHMAAVADLDEARINHIRSRYPQIYTTQDFHDLFEMNLDGVVVVTPPATHFAIAQECLENNLHVLVEKPFTLNSKDAIKLIQLSEEKDLVLMVGHTFEYNSAVHALKEIIQNGEIGKVLYIDSARLNLGLHQANANVLWDLAPHDISILLFLLEEEPISVSAQGMACAIPGVFDNVYMNLTFPGNILAHVHVSWLDPCKVRRTTVVGSEKMVVYNDIDSNEKIRIYDKRVEVPEYTDGFGEFHCNYRYGDVLIPHMRFQEPLKNECQHFLDCIVERKSPRSDGYDGLRVIKIIETAENILGNGPGQEKIKWQAQTLSVLHQM
jgi:predicted dehydrogenase